MKKVLFAFIFLPAALLLASSAMGQTRTDTLRYPNEKVIVETDSTTIVSGGRRYAYNSFWSNWFVSGGVGAQVFFGNQESLESLGKRITPTYEGSVGKWIHPAVGVRFKMGGGEDRSYSTGTLEPQGHSLIVGPPNAQGIYTLKWHHLYGELDAMVDLNNAIGGYNPRRFYSAIPYVGAGLDFVQNQPKHDADRTAIGVLGLINRFRVNNHFDVNVEIKDALVKQTYDRELSQRDFESYATVSVGIVYRIGRAGIAPFIKDGISKTVVERTYRPMVVVPATEPTEPSRDTAVKEEVIREMVTEHRHILTHPMAVFFELNKSDITNRAKVNLAFVADIIKASEGAKFLLVGSADNSTASPAYNRALSKRRSAAVREYLVSVLLVDPQQLILDPIGGIDQYRPAEVNRAVIIRQEQPQQPQP